jgi:cadmium resistance protein CadD (predicted permease)
MPLYGFLVAAVISVFAFIAVAVWSENRRKERETHHRHQTYQAMLQNPGENADALLALIREQDERQQQRKDAQEILGLKLGGLITTGVGVGLAIFLYFIAPDEPVYLVGLIPLFTGLALSYYAWYLAPQTAEARSDDESGR